MVARQVNRRAVGVPAGLDCVAAQGGVPTRQFRRRLTPIRAGRTLGRMARTTALLLLLALSGCRPKDPWARCKAALDTPLSRQSELYIVRECSVLFRPRCRDALSKATSRLTELERIAIVRTCAADYCGAREFSHPICNQGFPSTAAAVREGIASFVVQALRGTPGATSSDLKVVGFSFEDLLPKHAQNLRIVVDAQGALMTLDGGGSWHVGLKFNADDLEPLVAAVRANSPDPQPQLIVHGEHDLPQASRRLLDKALSAAGFEFVTCARDNSNCR